MEKRKIYRIHEELPNILTKKIVFTNGCFDLLHPGHLQYLREASLLGDCLVIGLNSDKSVSSLKGEYRPINNFLFRSMMLSYFDFVDYIIEFDEDTPEKLIEKLEPSILVKGADYLGKEIAGSNHVISSGGKIILIKFLEGFSSSKIINKIKSN